MLHRSLVVSLLGPVRQYKSSRLFIAAVPRRVEHEPAAVPGTAALIKLIGQYEYKLFGDLSHQVLCAITHIYVAYNQMVVSRLRLRLQAAPDAPTVCYTFCMVVPNILRMLAGQYFARMVVY